MASSMPRIVPPAPLPYGAGCGINTPVRNTPYARSSPHPAGGTMRTKLLALLLALPLVALSSGAFAQNSPVGKWHTIDDKTGKVKSVVEITEAPNGTLQGKV